MRVNKRSIFCLIMVVGLLLNFAGCSPEMMQIIGNILKDIGNNLHVTECGTIMTSIGNQSSGQVILGWNPDTGGLKVGGGIEKDDFGVNFMMSNYGPPTVSGYVRPNKDVFLSGQWSSVSGATATIEIGSQDSTHIHATLNKQGITGTAGVQAGGFYAQAGLTANGLIVSSDIRPGGAVDTANLSYDFKSGAFTGSINVRPGYRVNLGTLRMALAHGKLAAEAQVQGENFNADLSWDSFLNKIAGDIEIVIDGRAALGGIPVNTTGKLYNLDISPNVRVVQRGSELYFEDA
jgi:hypothetical protein